MDKIRESLEPRVCEHPRFHFVLSMKTEIDKSVAKSNSSEMLRRMFTQHDICPARACVRAYANNVGLFRREEGNGESLSCSGYSHPHPEEERWTVSRKYCTETRPGDMPLKRYRNNNLMLVGRSDAAVEVADCP